MTKRVILPAEATEEMVKGVQRAHHNHIRSDDVSFILAAALSASPASGKVAKAEVEKAFTKFHDAQHIDGLSEAEAFRAALSALGLEVE